MMAPRHRTFVLVPLLVVAGGCSTLFGPADHDTTPLTELPRALSVAEREVIEASNRFAFDILRETIADKPAENVFLSPISASMALGMAMNGARGETFDGMRTALGFGALERTTINESYRDLIALLRGLDGSVEMRVANSIWAREGYPFHAAFLDESRHYFDAEVATLDFNSPAALTRINDWVKRQTNNRIDRILDQIPGDYVMYLINAIYFNGSWRERFDRAQTRQVPFTREDGSRLMVDMMHRTGAARMNYMDDATVLELPYGRDAWAMTIVLPHVGRNVDDLVRDLDAATWSRWIAGLHERDVQVGLPRFRLEYETLMNEPLIRLGMGRAFGVTGRADFTGMSPRGHELEIGLVKQKTFLDVHEEGTEAAAVTAVGVRVVSAPPAVIVDRPFVMAIRERLTGTIVFLGRIGAPGA